MSDKDIENLGFRESLEGLPEELIKTLAISRTKQVDDNLLDIIKSFSGIATLDEIIIRQYRQTGGKEIPKRAYVNNRLLSLVQRNLLEKVEGKKAVYRLPSFKTSPQNPIIPIENVPEVDDDVPF